MERREFLKVAAGALAAPSWLHAEAVPHSIDLQDCVVITRASPSAREQLSANVLVQEAEKRCGKRWAIQDHNAGDPKTGIYLSVNQSAHTLGPRFSEVIQSAKALRDEGFLIRSGRDAAGIWITVIGADERSLLFGVGQLLRLIRFEREQAQVEASRLNITTHPRYRLRGHQLGYRPKTNAYDAWTVAMWDQYIRELALFGTNAIELVPPRTDDSRTSPHFPLPPDRMMVEMSRIADNYGLDVWIWYPALDKDYSNAATVEFALKEWGRIFEILPRIDAVFVPGGDPGSTPPTELFALLQKQKQNLRTYHPRGQMWVSSQGFNAEWTEQFLTIIRRADTKEWLDGIVFGPMSRLSTEQLRQAVPEKYPIRCYPDITHSVWCQYPVPDWDVAFALTEGREVINPRPQSHADIVKAILPPSIGFISYSEGCNDDVNKFVWSAFSWDPDRSLIDMLREFANFFVGAGVAEGFAQGLLSLEANWRGPLATNSGVEITLQRFQDMERDCSPAVLANWRFQQALFRAYCDAYVRRRLLDETAHVEQARGELLRILEIGWAPVTMGASPPAKDSISNGLDPDILLGSAQAILEETVLHPAARELRTRIVELGEALYQSIRMQLAVERYQGEAVRRGASLDTLDHPVSDTMWLRREIMEIRKTPEPIAKLTKIRQLMFRTDPGPGGFYDELGNTSNRPHLVTALVSPADPDFRKHLVTDALYPDTLQAMAPIAWKHWVQSLYDASITVHYPDLDPDGSYHLRVVYGGDEPRVKIRLMANENLEIHPYLLRPWPPSPQEFAIPSAATADRQLTLTWNAEPGGGGDGRGCQVAEVWLIRDASPKA